MFLPARLFSPKSPRLFSGSSTSHFLRHARAPPKSDPMGFLISQADLDQQAVENDGIKTLNWLPSLHYTSDIKVSMAQPDLLTTACNFEPHAVIHTYKDTTKNTIYAKIFQLNPAIFGTAALVPGSKRAIWHALFCYVASGKDSESDLRVELPLPSSVLHDALLSIGAIHKSPQYIISRSALFEAFAYAWGDVPAVVFPFVPLVTDGVEHPLRPPQGRSGSTVYSRRIWHLNQYFRLRVCGKSDSDLATLHDFMNQPRVNEFWRAAGDEDYHRQFLLERRKDPHTIALWGSYSRDVVPGDPAGIHTPEERAVYAEMYWVKEDKLGKAMVEAGHLPHDYDRGLHVLSGSEKHRGPHYVQAWLPSLVHNCFLSDPRTDRVLVEPNEKNAKMIKYFESVGFKRIGSVEFPHKTSALMVVTRKEFFTLCPF